MPKSLFARYTATAEFVLPDWLDLENQFKVENYYVRWDTLYVNLKNGKTISFTQRYDPSESIDWKHPDNEYIEESFDKEVEPKIDHSETDDTVEEIKEYLAHGCCLCGEEETFGNCEKEGCDRAVDASFCRDCCVYDEESGTTACKDCANK